VVLALNIASMGFWFSETTLHTDCFYDELEDLETKSKIVIKEDKVDDEGNDDKKRVLDKQAVALLSENFLALPDDIAKWPPLHEYMKGLVMLAKHNVHFKCEVRIFSSFLNALYGLMLIDRSIKGREDFEEEFANFYTKIFPELDEKDRFLEIIHNIGTGKRLEKKINLDEAFKMKLYCDAYFLNIYKSKIFALAKNIKGDAIEEDVKFASDGNDVSVD
jgi:DNA polymerase III delta prime subunit